MNSKLFGLIAGMGILAGGVIVVTNLGGKDDITVGEPTISDARLAPTEAEVVDRAVRASNDKLVHVVGVDVAKDSVVGDTIIGRAVVVDAVKENSECSVVFEAKEVIKEITDIHGSGKSTITRVDLDLVKYPRGTFVKLSGSLDKTTQTWIWNALLVGQSCKDIALEPGYLGSSMQELLALPDAMKAKILRTYGMCLDVGIDGKLNKEGKTHRCDVPYGDARAVAGEEIFFHHSFSMRDDLHIMPKKNAEVQKRYQTPDGGFREATAEPVKEVIK